MNKLTLTQQRELAEILFWFHFDQMAANAQTMTDRLRSREEKQSFNAMMKHINRHWRQFERKSEQAGGLFEESASLLGDVLRMFLTSDDPQAVYEAMKEAQG